jgi:hypothetical protein
VGAMDSMGNLFVHKVTGVVAWPLEGCIGVEGGGGGRDDAQAALVSLSTRTCDGGGGD